MFDKLYFPILDRLRKDSYWHEFAATVRRGVIALTYQYKDEDPIYVQRETLLKASNPLLNAGVAAQEIYLSYLSYMPSRTLTCGHRICDRCVERCCSADRVLARCLLCGATNGTTLRPKPLTAGIRVLSLSGTIAEANSIGHFLRTLRSKLRIPLFESFDLV